MRHQVKGRKLGRTTPHRKATLQALGVALIKEKSIKTTLPKAKELRRFVEPIITKSKTDSTHNRRQVFASLRDKYAVTELFENVASEVGDRPGGYTRIVKLGTRLGDAAQMAVIELVDYNDVKPEKKESRKKRTRRAGKSNKSTESEEAPKEKTPKKEAAKKEPKAVAEEDVKAAEVADEEQVEEEVKTEGQPQGEAVSEADESEAGTEDVKAEEDAPEGADEESEEKK
jgi:large subunit ribosomal protein L17